MFPSVADDPRLSRLPLPNCIRSPGLELFRKYHYPDGYALSCFSPETANVLKEISKVMTEPAPNVLEWKPLVTISDSTKPEQQPEQQPDQPTKAGDNLPERICETSQPTFERHQ